MGKDFSYLDLHPGKYGYIYKISNNVNDKLYIGLSTNIEKRYYNYENLRFKAQTKIYNACKKDGIENFTFTIIDHADNIDELNEKEIYYISKYNCVYKGYNCKHGGAGGPFTEELKNNISGARKEKIKNGYKRPLDAIISSRNKALEKSTLKEYVDGEKVIPKWFSKPKNNYELECNKLVGSVYYKKKFSERRGLDIEFPKREYINTKHIIPEYFEGIKIIPHRYRNPKNEYEILCSKKAAQENRKYKYICTIKFEKIGKVHIIPEFVEGKKVEEICFTKPKNDWEYCCRKLYLRLNNKRWSEGNTNKISNFEKALKISKTNFSMNKVKDYVNGVKVVPKHYQKIRNEYEKECGSMYSREKSKKDFCKKRGLDKYPD